MDTPANPEHPLIESLRRLKLVDPAMLDTATRGGDIEQALETLVEQGFMRVDQLRRMQRMIGKKRITCFSCLKRASIPEADWDGSFFCEHCYKRVSLVDGTAGFDDDLLLDPAGRLLDERMLRWLLENGHADEAAIAAARKTRASRVPRPTVCRVLMTEGGLPSAAIAQARKAALAQLRDTFTGLDKLRADQGGARRLLRTAMVSQEAVAMALKLQFDRALKHSEYVPLSVALPDDELTAYQQQNILPAIIAGTAGVEPEAPSPSPDASSAPAAPVEPPGAPAADTSVAGQPTDAEARRDASADTAGPDSASDAADSDTGAAEPEAADSEAADAGAADAGAADAGAADAGAADSEDAGTEDAGTEDAGTEDAGTEDAGTEDASTEDARAGETPVRPVAEELDLDAPDDEPAGEPEAEPDASDKPARPPSSRPPSSRPPGARPKPRSKVPSPRKGLAHGYRIGDANVDLAGITSGFRRLQLKVVTPGAQVPEPPRTGDAGMDLHCTAAVTIAPGAMARIPLGFASSFPDDLVGLIQDRSSLAMRGLHVLGGVIDSSYRGEWAVLLVNLGPDEQTLAAGDRIAQVLFVQLKGMVVVEVDDLPDSERGEGGFGSSGR